MGTQPSLVHLSKDSGTQPQSSFLELGALHTTPHTNCLCRRSPQRDRPGPTVASKGTMSHPTEGHPQHLWAVTSCMLPLALLPPKVKRI